MSMGEVFAVVETMNQEVFLPHLFFENKNLSYPSITVTKSGLGLLNPVTSTNKKYLSFQRESTKLVLSLIEEGLFYSGTNLLVLR